MTQTFLVIGVVVVYTLILIYSTSPTATPNTSGTVSATVSSFPRSGKLAGVSAFQRHQQLRHRATTEAKQQHQQHDNNDRVSENNRRRAAILEMTHHAWSSYMKAAAGSDELKPISNSSTNKWGNIGVTPIDSLDTLFVMNMKKEFAEAQELLRHVDMRQSMQPLSVFETIIRHVGGTLSAYALTNDTMFLDFAKSTVDGLMHAFDGPLSFPAHITRFRGTPANNQYIAKDKFMLAEFGSFQMELRYLAHLTGDQKYTDACDAVKTFLVDLKSRGWPSNPALYEPDEPIMPHRGLFPTFVTQRGTFAGAAGYAAMMDSFYEYLLKQWIQFGKKDDWLLELYEDAVEGLLEYLLRYSENTNYAILGYLGHTYHPTMDHLACFAPGMLLLGVMHGAHSYPNRNRPFSSDDVVAAATDIAATCYRFYVDSPTGLSGDSVEFNLNGTYTVRYPKYILRPEVLESIFYLYRYTHDERYRDWGWRIAEAINTHARTPSGFTALDDVTTADVVGSDSMESFFIAETLKYLFLLFSDDSALPLDEWVLTTEAHPLPILRSER